MAGKRRYGSFGLWTMVVVLALLLGVSVCLARPLKDSMKADAKHEGEEHHGKSQDLGVKEDHHEGSQDLDVESNGVVIDMSSLINFVMLPKGPVAPSGPSPIGNAVPTDSVSTQP